MSAGSLAVESLRLPARPLPSGPVVALLLCLGTVLQLLRQPGVPAWDTVLAEDGGIFLTDALQRPGAGVLVQPYEGYLHVVPRLLAAAAAVLPLQAAAVALSGGAALVVSLLCLWIWSASRAVLQTHWARGLLVVLVLLLPAAGFEAQASINNLHWYLDFACFWVFAAVLRTPGLAAAGALVAAAAALSDPLAGLFVPLAALRAGQALGLRPSRSSPRAWRTGEVQPWGMLAPAVFVGALGVQLLLGVAGRPPEAFLPTDPTDLPGTYGLRVAGSLLVGDRFLTRLFAEGGLAFAYGCLLLAMVAVATALASTRGRTRRLVALGTVYSVVWLAVPLLLRGTTIYLDRADPTLLGSRYMINPVLFLALALLIGVDDRAARPAGAPVLRAAVTGWLALVLAASFAMPSVRQDGPSWQGELTAAARRCTTTGGDSGTSADNRWGTAARAGQAVVPVAPNGPRPPWNVVVDCADLSRTGS